MNLAARSDAAELMDTDTTDAADYRACLRDLATVNQVFLAARPTLAFLDRAVVGWPRERVLRVCDVAFGEGDMLRKVAAWAQARGCRIELHGIDMNPGAAAAAQATAPNIAMTLHTGDVLAYAPDAPYDVILSSLFTHHLSNRQVVEFLRWMERHSVRGWFVNDLLRHPLPYHGFRAISAAFGWHRFVRHDGPVSIARAFRRDEWTALLAEAGVVGATIELWTPFRLCISMLR